MTMAIIIFTRLADISMSRNRVRPASSSLYLASYECRSHHDIVDRNFACLTFLFEAISARLVAGVSKVGKVRVSCGLQGKQT